MSIIKERIRLNRNDTNLKITLGSHDAFTGYQQEIDNMTQFTTTQLINPVIDGEMYRFKHINSNITIQFQFHPLNSTAFVNNGFTSNELGMLSDNVQKSFFILEYFDSFDAYTQNKIFTTYLTKIGYNAVYPINPTVNNQFYRWFVPVSYINSQTTNTAIGYVRFSFYNAKTGKIQLFYNLNNTTPETAERLFFKTELNIQNKTWKIISPSSTVTAREFISPYNQLYADRINETFNNFDNLQQNYPTGNTFNYGDATYLIT